VNGVETVKEVEVETVKYNLRHLKICFGHFGGEDEWAKYFEKDRDNFSSQLVRHPDKGIDFVLGNKKEVSPGKPEQLWRSADWYSIICSMMLQHPNVYADISYILHGDLEIRSLLKHTMQHPKLKERVLFGTDFYVVRNHKSDKNMLADTMASLNDNEFKQIAVINPGSYLQRNDIT
jgi:predicted TIM-barrel fold metal-dependent hydrolase